MGTYLDFCCREQPLSQLHLMYEDDFMYICMRMILRLVHMERVIRSSIGQFLRTRKTWSVRKFSILLRKRMRFMQVWMSLYVHKLLSMCKQ